MVRCAPYSSAPASTTCSSKSLGSSNPINIVHATVAALKDLHRPEEIAARRGLPIEDVAPAAMLRARNEGRERLPPPGRWPDVPRLKITQLRSPIGGTHSQRETLRTLGLKRLRDVVVKEDRPEIRGMVKTVQHLVSVEEVE